MDTCTIPGGLYPVMLTALKIDKSIDWRGMPHLVDWYLANEVNGLFAVCGSSEMYALTPTERLQLARFIVQRVNGRVPVVATGTFGGRIEAQAEFIQQMADTGVDAVVVLPNQLAGVNDSDDILRHHFERLMALTEPIALGLYECPSPYHRLLSPELLRWAGESKRFVYHKDTSCNLDCIRAKIDAVDGTPLQIFNAHTPTALDSLRYGAAGLSPVAANYYPELFVKLCQLARNDIEQAIRLQKQLVELEGMRGTSYPIGAKFFLQQRGLSIETMCRGSHTAIADADKGRLMELLKAVSI